MIALQKKKTPNGANISKGQTHRKSMARKLHVIAYF